jgi:hypothetical protein
MKSPGFLIPLVLGAMLTAGAALGEVVYTNDFGGITSGDNANESAWAVSHSHSTSDSFVLSSSTSLTAINLLLWERAGDSVSSLNWYILDDGNPTAPYSGRPGVNTIASGTVAPADTFTQFVNHLGWDVDEVSFDISTPTLTAGTTYWLQIDNVIVPGVSVFWDQSDGLSTAYESTTGPLVGKEPCKGLCSDSESFELLAGTEAPEPGSLTLLSAGLLGLAALRRRGKQA